MKRLIGCFGMIFFELAELFPKVAEPFGTTGRKPMLWRGNSGNIVPVLLISIVDLDPELQKCVGIGFRSVQAGKLQIRNLPRFAWSPETVSSWKSLASVVVVRTLLVSVATHQGFLKPNSWTYHWVRYPMVVSYQVFFLSPLQKL